DHACRLVAGERVQRAWYRGVGDDSRRDCERVAQTAQRRPDGPVSDRGDDDVRSGQLGGGESAFDRGAVFEEWVVAAMIEAGMGDP
ncbi:hypothetical protein OM076_44425, partial [Solirubrobacter ginsenosidimutans]